MAKAHKEPAEHDGEIMPLDIQSPILRIRMIKGLTRPEMALVLGTNVTTIANMETGPSKIGETVQAALTKLGEDGAKIAEEQEAFIERKREWLTKQFLERA